MLIAVYLIGRLEARTEKILGRRRNHFLDDDQSSIHAAEARDLSTALPPDQRRHAQGQGQKNNQRSLQSANFAYSSED